MYEVYTQKYSIDLLLSLLFIGRSYHNKLLFKATLCKNFTLKLWLQNNFNGTLTYNRISVPGTAKRCCRRRREKEKRESNRAGDRTDWLRAKQSKSNVGRAKINKRIFGES